MKRKKNLRENYVMFVIYYILFCCGEVDFKIVILVIVFFYSLNNYYMIKIK